jgi:sarcosine oxidase
LVGAAAAKYLSSNDIDSSVNSVVAIGPDEQAATMNSDVFGGHYDEGRITRKTDASPVWALLAQRSIDRYREIELESGVTFYHEIGHLVVGIKGGEHMCNVEANAKAAGIAASALDNKSLAETYPYINFPSNCVGISENMDSGWVSARKQVSAQLAIATKHGCTEVRTAVKMVLPCSGGFEVHGDDGSVIHAKTVLVAAGAFTNYRCLLPSAAAASGASPAHLQLDLQPRTAQTVKLKLSGEDAARLEGIPSLIYKIGTADYDWCYILPPILYPDGYYWFKIGGGLKVPLHSHSDVVNWHRMQGCNAELTEKFESDHQGMLRMVDSLFPGLLAQAIETKGDTCATAHTHNKLPYIGQVPEAPKGLFVATGGNGWAAKSADEIGRLAAKSVLAGETGWADQELSSAMFQPVLMPRLAASL